MVPRILRLSTKRGEAAAATTRSLANQLLGFATTTLCFSEPNAIIGVLMLQALLLADVRAIIAVFC